MSSAGMSATAAHAQHDAASLDRERRLESLIDRLPNRLRPAARWLRRPSSRWLRGPAGVLLIIFGILGVLPLLGFWMAPLGLLLLAEDVPAFRRARDWLLERVERHRPHWFTDATDAAPQARSAEPQSSPSAHR